LEHARALEVARRCGVFAMPSVDEAFGVAYVEAMAGGLPAIGCEGEPGPEEIARAGEGMRLVPPGDVGALRAAIEECLRTPNLGAKARRTVLREFTWEQCGAATVAAYEEALRG
ncbi:MAG TPA: glycosyltransferase, partial [Solirubrobacteraceae bacterium]|nr:glycosyltransferase [Solirubrobacteraceae bacterium]